MTAQLTCSFWLKDGSLPAEDDAFWLPLDELAEDIGALHSIAADGGPMCVSGDVPDWAHRFWIALPFESSAYALSLETALLAISTCRNNLPDATWTVELNGAQLPWDAASRRYVP